MTDQELIQLLQEKPPGEFTVDEFEALRARWTQSPELRQALIEHLKLESQLSGAFGQIDLDIDKILKRADDERRQSPAKPSSQWRWSVGLSLLLVCGLSAIFWIGRHPQQPDVVIGPERPKGDSGVEANRTVELASSDEPVDALTAIAASRLDSSTANTGVGAEPGVPIDSAADEPWSKTLARDIAPWPANSPKLTRDFKGSGHDELPEVEARRWFSQVEGHPFNLAQDTYGHPPNQRRAARFNGFARLRSPWPDDALLRLTPFEVTDLTIYLWRGPSGVAVRFYSRREPFTWAAFEVVRENSSPKPIRWGLLTTDNGGYVRAGMGTFDLRYQDGGITLARGGIPLLTAPLADRPDEVYVEGAFRLRGISIHRSAPLMSVPENPYPLLAGGPAAELPWVVSVETPAELIPNADGTATFRVDSQDKLGTMVVPLAQRGLYEVIARVDEADPGTGIFLGDLDGRPLHRVGFYKDAASGRTTIGVLRPGEVRDQASFDFNAFPPPYHTRTQWIKIIAGLGTVQVMISGDGRNWGHLTEDPARDLPGAVGSIGLFGLPGSGPRTMKLARLEVRPLTGLTRLADADLVALVPQYSPDEWKDIARWSHRTMDAMPAGVDTTRWINTCAATALTQGPSREFAVALLRRLMTVAIQSEIPVAQKLLILDEACLLADTWDEASARVIADHYNVIGEQLAMSGDPYPLTIIRPALVRSAMWSISKLRFAWERQASNELLATLYRSDWAAAWQQSHTTNFWNAGPHPDWVAAERADLLAKQARWTRAIAVENAPQLDDGQSGVVIAAWRHPLALQWNKEAYNVRSELQSALAGATYEDACRIVMSINVSDGPGLLPDMDDRQLFVSLPTAVAAAMQIHPEFARLMAEKFGPLGVIRVRQAIQSGDVRGVQSATLQFYGTEAAAEAHQWLGDLDLSAGRFPSAEEHFLLGLAHCLPRQRDGLQSRLQLALALNGKPLSSTTQPPMSSIELSGASISAGDLESLVKSLAARPSPFRRFLQPFVAPTPVLPPMAYRAETRATFDGQPGLNPGRYEYRFGDPFGKQLAAVVDDRRIFVSNRLQVNAYSLPTGQQLWAQALGSEQGEAHAMPFTPMPPLVAGDRLYVRRLGKGGTELACLNADNGQVLWTQRPNLHVLSDPIFWNGSLFALTLARVDEDQVQVEGTRFDFESGAPTSSQPLFRLRDGADRSYATQLTISGRLAVCSLSGISACFDGSGEIHWLRRHLWLPKGVDELSEDFRVAAPMIHDNCVVVSVPGVRAVSCMDLETGRQLWSHSILDLRGVIGVHGSRVLLDTVGGLMALALDDGHVAWTHPLEARLEAFQADDRMIVASQRVTVAPNKTRPCLVWLDLDAGRAIAESQIDGVERQEVQLGPVMSAGGKWWSLAGQGFKEAKRDLYELTSSSPLVPGALANHELGGWQADLPLPQLIDLALVLPGWCPEANYGPRIQMTAGDVRGETHVISAKVDVAHEVRLLQMVDVPVGRRTSLRLRFGNAPNQKWVLTVRADNQQLLEQLVGDPPGNNGWHDAAVDLTPFAGKRIPVQLIQSPPPKEQHSEAFWKRADVVVE
ncbi:MAG: PQQ-like beta-propeller repeat protein [Planctomycetes bacterium]|nr:PQQ-like beta-propeller repeat protein [Planctomycetota bacterium]